MKIILIVLLLFLVAFFCMALGVILGRRALRGGCGGGQAKTDGNRSECHCSNAKNRVRGD